jgi:hypothetical protein
MKRAPGNLFGEVFENKRLLKVCQSFRGGLDGFLDLQLARAVRRYYQVRARRRRGEVLVPTAEMPECAVNDSAPGLLEELTQCLTDAEKRFLEWMQWPNTAGAPPCPFPNSYARKLKHQILKKARALFFLDKPASRARRKKKSKQSCLRGNKMPSARALLIEGEKTASGYTGRMRASPLLNQQGFSHETFLAQAQRKEPFRPPGNLFSANGRDLGRPSATRRRATRWRVGSWFAGARHGPADGRIRAGHSPSAGGKQQPGAIRPAEPDDSCCGWRPCFHALLRCQSFAGATTGDEPVQ